MTDIERSVWDEERQWEETDLTPYLDQLHDVVRESIIREMVALNVPQEFWPPLIDRTQLQEKHG